MLCHAGKDAGVRGKRRHVGGAGRTCPGRRRPLPRFHAHLDRHFCRRRPGARRQGPYRTAWQQRSPWPLAGVALKPRFGGGEACALPKPAASRLDLCAGQSSEVARRGDQSRAGTRSAAAGGARAFVRMDRRLCERAGRGDHRHHLHHRHRGHRSRLDPAPADPSRTAGKGADPVQPGQRHRHRGAGDRAGTIRRRGFLDRRRHVAVLGAAGARQRRADDRQGPDETAERAVHAGRRQRQRVIRRQLPA